MCHELESMKLKSNAKRFFRYLSDKEQLGTQSDKIEKHSTLTLKVNQGLPKSH